MGFSVNTNIAALGAYRNLATTKSDQASALEKLSSGLRINRAADDAAGLSIAEGLKSQVNGYNVAQRNAQDGISVIQVAEGALGEAQSILQRMRDLAVQGANDTNSADARTAIEAELGELTSELDRITKSTNFNGTSLLQGGDALSIQVGADGDANNKIDIALADLGAVVTALGTPSVADHGTAQTLINTLDTQITAVSTARSELGATQNRLEHATTVASVAAENLTAAESRIRDVDMAKEMMEFNRTNILSQAGTAMLAQANASSQGILQLLG